MLALSLFGTVSGLEVRTFGQMPISLSDEWVALSSGDLKLAEGSTVVSVHRRSTEAGILTWVGLYRSAIEMTSDRGGGCVGAGVWLLNKAASAEPTLRLLHELTAQVTRLAMSGGRFTRRLSAIESSINWHDDIGRVIRQSLVDVSPGMGLRAGDAPRAFFDARVVGAGSALAWLVDAAQSGSGFLHYRSLFVSADDAVVDSARRVGRLEMLTPEKLLKGQMTHEQEMQHEVVNAKREVQHAAQALKVEEEARRGLDEQLQGLRLRHDEALRRLRDVEDENRQHVAEAGRQQNEIQSVRRESERIERDVREREVAIASTARKQEEEQRNQQRKQADLHKLAQQIEATDVELGRRRRRLEEDESLAEERARRMQDAEARAEKGAEKLRRLEKELATTARARDESHRQYESLRKQFDELHDRHTRWLAQLEAKKHALADRPAQVDNPKPSWPIPAEPPRLAAVGSHSGSSSVYVDRPTKQEQPSRWRILVMLFGATVAVVAVWSIVAILWPRGGQPDLGALAAPEAQQRCEQGWSFSPRNAPTALLRINDRTASTATAGALWGLACGAKKRDIACLDMDVARIVRALEKQAQNAEPGDTMHEVRVKLPQSCGMPSSLPWMIGAVEPAPESTVTSEPPLLPSVPARSTSNAQGDQSPSRKIPSAASKAQVEADTKDGSVGKTKDLVPKKGSSSGGKAAPGKSHPGVSAATD